MATPFDRTAFLVGEEAIAKLKASHVIVFGIGGVGGTCCEALIRSGVGELTFVDYDRVDITNLNRQILATTPVVGELKVQVLKDRLSAINSEARFHPMAMRYEADTSDAFSFDRVDYVVDAIDMVTSKLTLIEACLSKQVPIISAMGFGNRLDPTMVRIGDVYETNYCPLARVMRRELRKRGIQALRVAHSLEQPYKQTMESEDRRKATPGSSPFVPSAAGLAMASAVFTALIRGSDE